MKSTQLPLNTQQTEALAAIKAFLKSKDPVFILKGSAGTGKTTLMQAICQHLKKAKMSFKLTATTGRAAKVLSAKTGVEASTLHGLLYVFDEVAGNDTSGADTWESKMGQLFLNFGLRQINNPQEQHLYGAINNFTGIKNKEGIISKEEPL